jgi:hypothetical protein
MRILLGQTLKAAALTAIILLCGSAARAQTAKRCIAMNFVGADASNPFTAERVTTSTMPTPSGAPKMMVLRELIARDSQGRLRFERRGIAQPPDDRKTVALETRDGKPFEVTREEFGTQILIFDCASGTSINMQPGLRIASVTQNKNPAPTAPQKRAYSTPYIPGPGVKVPPNMVIEQLGTREMQGIPARGVKTTTLGTEADADWNGKPIGELELWVSDGLAAHMVRIDRDLRAGSETKSELVAIKREEPDPALFEIPKDYEINPAIPGGLPIMKFPTLPNLSNNERR